MNKGKEYTLYKIIDAITKGKIDFDKAKQIIIGDIDDEETEILPLKHEGIRCVRFKKK